MPWVSSGSAAKGAAAMNPFLAFGLWFVTVVLALVFWMLRTYGA